MKPKARIVPVKNPRPGHEEYVGGWIIVYDEPEKKPKKKTRKQRDKDLL